MVDILGEREIPCTVSLELLAVAAEMASDHPQLQETSQTSNAEKDSSTPKKAYSAGALEQKTAG